MGAGGKVVGSLFGFGVGSAFSGALFGTASWLIGGIYGASLASNIWAATHQPSGNGASYSYDYSTIYNQVSSTDRIPIIYGSRKWGGYTTWYDVSSDKKTLTKDILLCEGEVTDFVDVRADDIKIGANQSNPYLGKGKVFAKLAQQWNTDNGYAPDCNYYKHFGSVDQEPPANYSVTGGYKNCAWLRATLTASEKLTGSNPTVTCVVKGKKIYDTRDGITEYSENPAMIVRDYLLSKRYGAGYFITEDILDEDSFKEVADYCDELVSTRVPTTLSTADEIDNKITALQTYLNISSLSDGARDEINNEIIALQKARVTINTQPVEYTIEITPRYTLNMIVAQTTSHRDILMDMFSCFGGFLVFSNNKVSLRVEKAIDVSYDFTDDNIVKDSLSYTQYTLDETPNRYNVTFYDPTNNFSGVKVIVEDTVDQKERQKIISKDVDLVGCTSQSQALRLARMYMDKNKLCSIVIQFQTATMAMHLEPGDIVTVTHYIYPSGVKTILFDHMPFRILEIGEEKGIYTIKAEQYNSSIYNDTLGAQIQVKNYVKVSNPFSDAVSQVTDVSLNEYYRDLGNGSVVNDVKLMFSCSDKYYSYAEVYVLSDSPSIEEIGSSWDNLTGTVESISTSSGAWNFLGMANDSIYLTNAKKGSKYTFKIYSVNSVGRKSDPVYVEYEVKGKSYTPLPASGLMLSFTDTIVASWNTAPQIDIDFFELRADTNAGNPSGLLVSTTSTKADITGLLSSRTGKIYLFTHNTAGYYSDPTYIAYKKDAPTAPTNVTATDIFQGVVIECDSIPQYCKGINVHIDNGTSTTIYFSSNNTYTYSTTGGIFDIQVAYIDVFGEGALSTAIEKTVEPKINPEWIKAESLSLDLMDSTIKAAVSAAQNAVSGTTFTATVNQLNQADSTLSNSLTQTSEQTTSIITELGKDNPSYTSFTQLNSAINLRASKANLISQINVCPEAITIDGKYIHITGDTVIDGNVIAGGMIKSGSISTGHLVSKSITTDKIATGAITADKISANSLSAISATIGTLRTATSGARTEIKDNLIEVFDSNNVLRVRMGVW